MTKKNENKKPSAKKNPHGSAVAPRALQLADSCAYCGGISKSTMRRAVKRGLLTPSQPMRHWLFTIEELDRFLELGRLRFAKERAANQSKRGGDSE